MMSNVSQQLLTDSTTESKNLIRQTVGDLSERLQTLENQAREKEQELLERNRQWRLYQDQVKHLQGKLAEAQEQYSDTLRHAPSGSLEHQLAENKVAKHFLISSILI